MKLGVFFNGERWCTCRMGSEHSCLCPTSLTESGTLFAHSWLRILAGSHPAGADGAGRPKAGLWLCAAANDRCVGSWPSNVVTTCTKSCKNHNAPPPRGCSSCGRGAAVEVPHHWPDTAAVPSPSVLCNLLGKALLSLGQPPDMLGL